MQSIKKFLLLIIVLAMFTTGLIADEKIELKNYFLDKVDQIVTVAKDKNLAKSKRNRDIIKILTPLFNFQLMAKLSLGKRVWNSLNSNDKERFINLYVRRMELSYSSKLDSYTDEKVKVNKILQPKKNRISFDTSIVGNGKKLDVLYKFYKPKKPIEFKHSWMIFDVEVSGVSILKADKAQFRDFLQTKSISELMDAIQKAELK